MEAWRQRLESVLTPAFHAWWRLRRSITLGVRGVACDAQRRVLLVRHTYAPGWHFPGGGVERNETALAGLKREMAEEAGIAFAGAPALHGIFSNHANFKNDHILVYRVDPWTPCEPLENGEIAERGFFALDALPPGVTKGTRRRLAEIFEGAEISERW